MTDIEKVIQGIKACWSEHFCHKCIDCPYDQGIDVRGFCREQLCEDAIALLKKQEAKLVRIDEDSVHCPSCGNELFTYPRQKFCDECGQEVKWE